MVVTSPPRASRLGLYAPLVLLVAFAAACTGAWFALDNRVRRATDAERAWLLARGYRISWAERRVHGYPFRLDVDLTDLRLSKPSGWSLWAPSVKSEVFIFAPAEWVLVAPQGAVLSRDGGRAPVVQAAMVRASVQDFDRSPPQLSIDADNLRFGLSSPAPVSLRAAQSAQLHTRAGPQDHGAVYLELDQAQARLPGLLGRIADGRPVSLSLALLYSHASDLTGATWPAAARSWTDAGGLMKIEDLRLEAGRSLVEARSGFLGADRRGRLSGAVEATLSAEAAPGSRTAPATNPRLRLVFRDGQTRLGAVVLGAAPSVF